MKPHRISLISLFTLLLFLTACSVTPKLDPLPTPQRASGIRGEMFGIDANINEETIDQYLNREDCAYYDVRMIEDPANYEAIGGDSRLSGILEGFEVVPFPYFVDQLTLPEEVLPGYEGRVLFHRNEDGTLSEVYEESRAIIESIFPKDKAIILMCGGGGYAGMMKDLLIELGYDENKIYNAGGYWYYKGEHSRNLLKEDGSVDLSEVTYHIIDFDSLTRKETPLLSADSFPMLSEDIFTDLDSIEAVKSLQDHKQSFLLYLHLPGCLTCASFTPIVREVAEEMKWNIYHMNINITNATENFISQKVSFAPSVLVFHQGDLIGWLDAENDADNPYYRDTAGLREYLKKYIQMD